MSKNVVSNSVIRRLPRYYRFLGELEKQEYVRISSRELAEKMGLTASQIRQDLNCFGGFGQQGYGYNVKELHEEIGNILGVKRMSPMILIGAGNLGKAIATHIDFCKSGFELVGIFDINPEIVGKTIGDIEVKSTLEIDRFCAEYKPSAAVLCIPKEAAADVANQLISYGISAFWNFSHYDLSITHKNVIVENVHLGDSLLTLSYGLKSLYSESQK
jgi:redox-sensing transcriptional repressor